MSDSMSATWTWRRLLSQLFSTGEDHSPRGQGTLEILGYRSELSMQRPVIWDTRRKLNYRFMVAEAHWILSGSNRVADIEQYCSQWKQYSDNGIFLRGAYGPRVVDQLDYVTEALARDPDTRQSVMEVWRPNPRGSLNIPCTLTLQFLVRDKHIHCVVNMRSSDAWLGWPYDVFSFTMIAWYVGLMTNLFKPGLIQGLGKLILFAGSQHLYEYNCKEARELLNAPVIPQDEVVYVFNHFNHPEDLMTWLRSAVAYPKGSFPEDKLERIRI